MRFPGLPLSSDRNTAPGFLERALGAAAPMWSVFMLLELLPLFTSVFRAAETLTALLQHPFSAAGNTPFGVAGTLSTPPELSRCCLEQFLGKMKKSPPLPCGVISTLFGSCGTFLTAEAKCSRCSLFAPCRSCPRQRETNHAPIFAACRIQVASPPTAYADERPCAPLPCGLHPRTAAKRWVTIRRFRPFSSA